ncbi:Hypothetical protein PHPALM_15380 [Phytophthora palmivora]|uniref:Uncharacterized protein n=1 Tax=Phytophthora palmivora TaxID=4796 RepID=A0A2P4XSI7_9STRA|nr:Hypothetical protein PHPALM_15380 [Phytophthora palmivora]
MWGGRRISEEGKRLELDGALEDNLLVVVHLADTAAEAVHLDADTAAEVAAAAAEADLQGEGGDGGEAVSKVGVRSPVREEVDPRRTLEAVVHGDDGGEERTAPVVVLRTLEVDNAGQGHIHTGVVLGAGAPSVAASVFREEILGIHDTCFYEALRHAGEGVRGDPAEAGCGGAEGGRGGGDRAVEDCGGAEVDRGELVVADYDGEAEDRGGGGVDCVEASAGDRTWAEDDKRVD